ncbi:hypothetical protein KQI86_19450 [Clostridium sp. MSJ-11]|uniref:Phage protein n=1 Tax=Clostridium mobile TaxID=2841512 RepID=A0ABS6EML1_9CLOT|nr:hypothetical protein [Clostridium mobile]MBU5486480.1 hypothetical protein [Clostridium mobile]
MKELMSKELIEAKNSITSRLDLDDMNYEDAEVVVAILNMFNEKNYLISDATKILTRCIGELKNCPVIKYENC